MTDNVVIDDALLRRRRATRLSRSRSRRASDTYTLYPFDEVSNKGVGTRRVWIAEAQMNSGFHDLCRDEKPLVAICRLRVAEAIAAGVIKLEQAA